MAKRKYKKKQGRPVTSSDLANGAIAGVKPKPKPKPARPSKPIGPPAPKPKPIRGIGGVVTAGKIARNPVKSGGLVLPAGNRPKRVTPAKPKTLPKRPSPGRRGSAPAKSRGAVGVPPKKKATTSSSSVKAAVKKAAAPKTAKVSDTRYRIVDVNGQRKLMLKSKADAYEAERRRS